MIIKASWIELETLSLRDKDHNLGSCKLGGEGVKSLTKGNWPLLSRIMQSDYELLA